MRFVTLVSRRALAMLFVCFGVTLVAFVLTHLVPGNPVAAALGTRAYSDPAIVNAYRETYGLNRPLPVQYGIYLVHLIYGDFGRSLVTGQPVGTDLVERVPASLELALYAMLLATLVGLPLGVLAAVRRGSRLDRALTLLSIGGIATPLFWVGLMFLYLFSFVLGIAPSNGRLSPGVVPPSTIPGLYTIDSVLTGDWATLGGALHHLFLPALVLSLPNTGVILRFTRSAVLEVIGREYITEARAKGLPQRSVLVRYVLRA